MLALVEAPVQSAPNSNPSSAVFSKVFQPALSPPSAEVPAEEAAQPKALKDPLKPTPQEVREHEIIHLPYIHWRRHCVRGKGKNMPHRKMDAEQSHAVSHISIDFCYFGQEEESL